MTTHCVSAVCSLCGRKYREEEGVWRLSCDGEVHGEHGPALLRSVYDLDRSVLSTFGKTGTLADFSQWLPCSPTSASLGTCAPACYRSGRGGLGEKLGLNGLWISFSGFWPEKSASLASCTFKELEAASIAGRLEAVGPSDAIVVVASAGNTARAFAQAFSKVGSSGRRLLLVVPDDAVGSMLWSPEPFAGRDRVRLVSVCGGGDYADSIRLADLIVSRSTLFIGEGGARNIGRRDGMATSLIAAACKASMESGEEGIVPPDHYFQAIGSGTGGIAAWEAAERIREAAATPDGRARVTRLHLSQNAPFTPMVDAWEGGRRRELPEYVMEDSLSRAKIGKVGAYVLTNRKPPYSIVGGVFDALKATSGKMYSVTNEQADDASREFEKLEGIDIDPAAAVAVASLMMAVRSGEVKPNDRIVLNITGGGQRRLMSERKGIMHHLEPTVMVDVKDIPEIASGKKTIDLGWS